MDQDSNSIRENPTLILDRGEGEYTLFQSLTYFQNQQQIMIPKKNNITNNKKDPIGFVC